jgi:hypothetical protein
MHPPSLLAFDLTQWATFAILMIGLGSAGLALFVSKLLFRGHAKPHLPLPETKDTKPDGDPFVSGSPDEKRQAFRRGNRLTKVFISAAAVAEPFKGWVLDRSVHGLGLLLDKPIPKGAILKVRPAEAPADTPDVEVRVRWCKAKDAQWELGCAFVRSPACSVLLLFG